MEKTLQIQLLGNFHLVYDNKPVTGLDSPRLQSLLAYLLINRDSPIQRQHLSYLFWPDSTDSQARTNLRNLLHRLRENLPEADQFLEVGSKTLWWKADTSFNLDLDDFEAALAKADKKQKTGKSTKLAEALEKAVGSYGGDLLPSCYDDWIFPERERLTQEYIRVLEELVKILEEDQDYPGAIKFSQQLLRHDPLHEATSRLLMELHALNGDTARALRVYHSCVDALEKELGLEPSPATLYLYEQLLDRDLESEKHPRITEKGTIPVGREESLRKIQKTWRDLKDRPQLVLIKGEAGIGKTYLAEAFIRWTRKQGIKDLKTRSYATEGELAYTPLTALLRSELILNRLPNLEQAWLVELSRLLPELKEKHTDLPEPEELSESWQRGRMFEACARAVLGGLGKLVIQLDDLQWCDRETLDWIRFLIEFKTNTRLMLVATLRTEDLVSESALSSLITDLKQKGLVDEIELESLDQETTAALAANLWGDPLDDLTAERLFQETEGNPLFVVEVVRSGYLKESLDPEATFSLPPKVQAVIEARLAGLSPETQELSSLAAVLGRDFDFELLFQAGEMKEEIVLQSLDELWQRRVIRDQGAEGYDFSHDKFREVITQGLSPHRRTHLHLKIAQSLEEIHQKQIETMASQIGYHFQLGGKPDQAIDYYIQAGDQARRVYARDDAVTSYQTAADLIGDKQDLRLIKLYQGWGNALLKLARYQEASEAFLQMRSAAKAANDGQAEAQAWLALGKVRDRQGDFQDALICADKTIEIAQGKGFEAERANGVLLKGQQHYRLGDTNQAELFIKEALELNKKSKNQLAVGRCLNLLGLIEDLRGNFTQARQYKEDAITLFEGIEDRLSQWWIGNITLNLAITADLQGDYQAAIDLYQNAMDKMENISDQDWKRTCLLNLSAARVGLGEYQQSEFDLLQVLELTGSSEWLGLSLTYYFLAECYLGQKQINKALEAALKALDLAQESGAQEHLGAAWRILGKVSSQMADDITIKNQTYPASGCFKNSEKIFSEVEVDRERAHTLKAWAIHESSSGDKKLGEKKWVEAREIFQRLDLKAELKRMEKE